MTDSPRGIRQMQTLRKLPTTAPKTKRRGRTNVRGRWAKAIFRLLTSANYFQTSPTVWQDRRRDFTGTDC